MAAYAAASLNDPAGAGGPTGPRAPHRARWRRILGWIAAVLALLLIALAVFLFKPAPLPDLSAARARLPQGAALVERGRALTIAADCLACHLGPSGVPYAGGRPMELPFGTLYSPNITPDRETGIGGWTDEQFVRALKHGIDSEGRNLYPAFSYTSYALMSDEDALAIKAFLFSLKPVAYTPPANTIGFPFNQRYFIRLWNALFLPSAPITPDPSRPEAWNRGNYLVNALAHCGECHTPRNLAFAMDKGRAFAGAPLDKWQAWNITPDQQTGIGGWSDADLARYLSTGHADGHGSATGGMGEAVDLSLRHLPPADIAAIITYLRSVEPHKGTQPVQVNPNPPALAQASLFAPGSAPDDPQQQQGRKLFAGSCAGCHGWNGEGRETPYAALRGAKSVNDPRGANVMQVVLGGAKLTGAQGQTYVMPKFDHEVALSDAELAALTAFVVSHFGGQVPKVTPQDAKKARP